MHRKVAECASFKFVGERWFALNCRLHQRQCERQRRDTTLVFCTTHTNRVALQAVEDSETSRMEERSRPQIAVFRPTDANCRRSSKSPDRGPRRSKSPEGIAERRSSKSPERRPIRSKSPERIAIKRISESPDRSPRTFLEREAGP